MKKFLATFLSIVFIFQFTLLPGCAKSVKIKSGTTIPIAFNVEHNSKNVAVGAKIEGTIDKDIIINDVLVFKKGDRATLNVAQVKKAGFVGIPGELTIAGGEIFDTNNTAHRIDFTRNFVGEEKTWPKVCLGCGLLIILAPIALFGFVKGGQAEIKPFIPIEIKTAQDFEFTPEI